MPEVDTGDVEALTAGDVETVVPIVTTARTVRAQP